MIEIVARAVLALELKGINETFETVPEGMREEARKVARAAIIAIRDNPTDKMLDEGAYYLGMYPKMQLKEVWQAMLDKELGISND